MDDRDRSLAKAMFNEAPRKVEWAEASATTHMRWLLRAQEIRKRMEQDAPKTALVEDWKWRIFRSWSSWFVMAVTFIGSNALNYLDVIASVLSMLPPELRAFIPIPAMILLFGGYALLKMLKQKQK